jgi:hypothetical protein
LFAYEQYRDQGTQKLCQPAQEEAEVVTGGGEDGIDAVALTALEMVAVRAVFDFEMADDRLYRAALRFISRRMGAVTRLTWPLIQTLNLCGWLRLR